MKSPIAWLLFVALAFGAAPVFGKTLMARGSGQLVIDVDGSVAEVRLTRGFGEAIDEVVMVRMRDWRFEPIEEAGRPVQAIAHMSFDLAATFDDAGRSTGLGITDVSFTDPPGQRPAKGQYGHRPPRYPTNALKSQLGARVYVRVLIGADGSVMQAAPQSGTLLIKASRVPNKERWLKQFSDVSVAAIRSWQFEPAVDGQPRQAVVPIWFEMQHASPWNQAHAVTVAPQPWMLDTDATALATYGPGGEAPDTRMKLLTPLDAIEDAEG
jgi:hypothetical protein